MDYYMFVKPIMKNIEELVQALEMTRIQEPHPQDRDIESKVTEAKIATEEAHIKLSVEIAKGVAAAYEKSQKHDERLEGILQKFDEFEFRKFNEYELKFKKDDTRSYLETLSALKTDAHSAIFMPFDQLKDGYRHSTRSYYSTEAEVFCELIKGATEAASRLVQPYRDTDEVITDLISVINHRADKLVELEAAIAACEAGEDKGKETIKVVEAAKRDADLEQLWRYGTRDERLEAAEHYVMNCIRAAYQEAAKFGRDLFTVTADTLFSDAAENFNTSVGGILRGTDEKLKEILPDYEIRENVLSSKQQEGIEATVDILNKLESVFTNHYRLMPSDKEILSDTGKRTKAFVECAAGVIDSLNAALHDSNASLTKSSPVFRETEEVLGMKLYTPITGRIQKDYVEEYLYHLNAVLENAQNAVDAVKNDLFESYIPNYDVLTNLKNASYSKSDFTDFQFSVNLTVYATELTILEDLFAMTKAAEFNHPELDLQFSKQALESLKDVCKMYTHDEFPLNLIDLAIESNDAATMQKTAILLTGSMVFNMNNWSDIQSDLQPHRIDWNLRSLDDVCKACHNTAVAISDAAQSAYCFLLENEQHELADLALSAKEGADKRIERMKTPFIMGNAKSDSYHLQQKIREIQRENAEKEQKPTGKEI